MHEMYGGSRLTQPCTLVSIARTCIVSIVIIGTPLAIIVWIIRCVRTAVIVETVPSVANVQLVFRDWDLTEIGIAAIASR